MISRSVRYPERAVLDWPKYSKGTYADAQAETKLR